MNRFKLDNTKVFKTIQRLNVSLKNAKKIQYNEKCGKYYEYSEAYVEVYEGKVSFSAHRGCKP